MSLSNFNGSSLLQYSNDLIKNLEEMKEKKELLKHQILEEEDEKIKIENELSNLASRLEKSNDSISKFTNEYIDIEKTINETENARAKIADSYKTLLSVLQKESYHITKTKN